MSYKIINVNSDNIHQHPQTICFINPKDANYNLKTEWLKECFQKGLKIKLLYLEGEKKPAGFIEYVPGEYAWRAVDAKNYLFIHCLWVYPNKHKNRGYGSLLINECISEALEQGKSGAAVITSEDSFMAKKNIFLKQGFNEIQTHGKYSLLVKETAKGELPKFNQYDNQLKDYEGLNIVYSKQCPWVARFIKEVEEFVQKKGISIKIKELTSAQEAQKAPSVYATFNLIYNGKLLADHYISIRRFENIISKEIKGISI